MTYQDPNFTIVTSGGCNSFCEFCTDPFKRKASTDYLKNFEDVIFNRLPSHFDQISISGGEPTISPHLIQILGLIKLSNRFRKTVLTTNGTGLRSKIIAIAMGVDHVNVSRHAIGYETNTAIFGTADIITDEDLKYCAQYLNKHGVDVNLNHVYSDKDILNMDYVFNYIDYAKSVGATSVSFRYDQNQNSIEQTYLEKLFEDWVRVNQGSCPVCRNHTVLISGMPVVFKAAYAEPSKAINDVYELIYHIDGRLTSDWAGENEFTKNKLAEYERTFHLDKVHTAAKMGITIPKIVPRAKPFTLATTKEVKNTLLENMSVSGNPVPPKKEKKKTEESYGGGCGGGYGGGGCGKS